MQPLARTGNYLMSKENHSNDGSPADHGNGHGTVPPSILTSQRGIRALKWSLVGLFITAALQAVVVWYSGSIAACGYDPQFRRCGDGYSVMDRICGRALEAHEKIYLRFRTRRGPGGPFYRIHDLSQAPLIAAYESILHIIRPQPVTYLWAVMAASIVGFLGNEAVAIFRIRVGKQIGSAALVADGYHARTDGLTSLAVLAGAIGVWLGFPLADPIVGLVITLMVVKIGWDASKSVFSRMLDGVDPDVQDEIKTKAASTEGVLEVSEVRVRWFGHEMIGELNVSVEPDISVEQGHEIALRVRRELLQKLEFLSNVTIHIDPATASGEKHHHDDQFGNVETKISG